MTIQLSLLVLCSYLLRPVSASAQPGSAWPRHPNSGKIVFDGVLPWPETGATPAQQRAWARRWYRANLTAEKPSPGAMPDTVFEGLRNWDHLDSISYDAFVPSGQDSAYYRVIWRLGYQVNLKPTPAGLAYHLSEFECYQIVYDTGSSAPLEEVLGQFSPQMAVFHRRLRRALAHW